MLSSSALKNVEQASHYYHQKDDYYTKDQGIEQSEWFGRGAEKLGLRGEVDPELFTALLKGKLPNGEIVGKIVDGKIIHRPGWDLTFSAPKSVSILALAGGDHRLIEAHCQAVKQVLKTVEQSCAQTRIKSIDGVRYENTHNIVTALYHHDLSREQDPQLHTHSVVMNVTERRDGKWRSQASQIGRYGENATTEVNGFIERVRHSNRYFSKMYEAELAFRVKELGYDITTDTKTKIFEIVGVPSQVLQLFSKRRADIVKQLTEKKLEGGKAAAVATLDTRVNKKSVDRAMLKEQWVQEAKPLAFDAKQMIEQSKHAGLFPFPTRETLDGRAMEAVIQATKDLSVFQSTFSLEELVTVGCEYAIPDHVNVETILAAVAAQIKSGDLLSLANESGKIHLMAKSTLDEEKRIFNQCKLSQLEKPVIAPSDITRYVKRDKALLALSQENVFQLKTIFGLDRIVIIEGEAAKEALLQPLLTAASAARLQMTLLSPTLASNKKLASKVNNCLTVWQKVKSVLTNTVPNYQSVMKFLSDNNDIVLSKRQVPDVILVENAELLSTHHMCRLFEMSEAHQTKLILLGNRSTLISRERGILLSQLTDHHIATISIAPKANSMMKAVEDKNITGLVDKLSGHILEVPHAEDRHKAMATHYANLDGKLRKESWLVAHQKQSVNALNRFTHDALVEKGKLKNGHIVSVLIPIFLADGKRVLAGSYQPGQVVRFNETYQRLYIKGGDYLRVISHHKTSNRVLLEHANGKRISWQPDRIAANTNKIELFAEEQREIAVNEILVASRSLHASGVVKGERLVVTAVHRQQLKLVNSEGKIKKLDLRQASHRHIDYGYAATPHNLLHEKPAMMMVELPTRAFHTDQRRFFHAMTQPRETWVYTDNSAGFAQHIEKKTGNRLTAHETLAAANHLKKDLHALHETLEWALLEHYPNYSKPALSRVAIKAVEHAINHLSEREAGFTHKHLIQHAIEHALGDVTPEAAQRVVLAMEKAGIILRGQYKNDGTLWTTAAAVSVEREIIALCEQDKGKFAPLVNDHLLQKYVDPSKLKTEQIAAVKAITQSTDRVIAVQGHPGTGKTTMLVTIADVLAAKNMITGEGYQLRGLAPTHTAVAELTQRGIPAETLDNFLIHAKRALEDSKSVKHNKTILIIDEASMVSNHKMLEVLQLAHQLDYRGIVPTGDTRQLSSIEAGKPFTLVQRHVNTQELVDIRRQSDNAPLLKQAVKETIDYDFKAAFNTLKDSIIEVPLTADDKKLPKWDARAANRLERVGHLVKDYFSFAREERDHIQVITPGHDDRALANSLIRKGMKAEGSLSPHDQTVFILASKNLTQAERTHVPSLSLNDVLRFGKRESVHIKAGDYYSIVAINKDHSVLTLEAKDGRQVVWQVPTFDKKRLSRVEVFEKQTRKIQAGDLIRWSRSDKKHALLSTETARVLAVDDKKMTVELANQQVLTFDPRQDAFQHWDHGYAATVYAVQGKTKDIVLAHLESFREKLTTQPAFLVALTRSVNTFRLYTDNTEKLLKTIARNAGIKLSALEVRGEIRQKHRLKQAAPSSILHKGVELNGHNLEEKIHKPDSKINQKVTRKSEVTTNTTLAKIITPALKREKAASDYHPFDRAMIARIKDGLNQNAEQIAIHFLGTPKERGHHYLKFGRRQGSLTVTIKGEKQGWFNDFESNEGGRDMLRFIQLHGKMERKEALKYAASWLGIVPASHEKANPFLPKEKGILSEKTSVTRTEYEKRRVALANKIARESVPVTGTLAERYLREHRGITLDHMPDDIRFHPSIYSGRNQTSLPALVAIARDKDGMVRSVEAIFLDEKTANKANVPLTKQTIGPKKGAVVAINQAGNGAPTLIAEGVVTGLSLANALPCVNVQVTLGKQMLTHIDPMMLPSKVVFSLDNDGKNLKADTLILEASNRLMAHKKEVSFMVPTALQQTKQDYNDVIKQRGIQVIQQDFKGAVSHQDFYKPIPSVVFSAEKIASLAKEMTRNMNQPSRAEIKAYESITQGDKLLCPMNTPPPIEKIPPRASEIEREL